MKRAAVDLGTNSARLLVAEVEDKIERIEKITTITRLGQGVDKSRRLSNEAIDRNIDLLLKYKKIAEGYGVYDIKAIATSAVRDAANKDEFVKRVKDAAGIDLDVISGDLEAELGFLGASSIMGGEMCTVIDIGGGSTEFIAGKDGVISKAKSIDIGAVRLTEKFFGPDMPVNVSVSAAHDYIVNMIQEIAKEIKGLRSFMLLGIGGTVTTLAAIDMELSPYDCDRVHRFKLQKSSVDDIFKRLISMSLDERKKLKGLQPERVDIIPAGTLILKTIMEELNIDYITVSEYDNLEGLLLKGA